MNKNQNHHSPFLVLNLSLDIIDGIRRFDFKRDRLPCKGLDENLHLGHQWGKSSTTMDNESHLDGGNRSIGNCTVFEQQVT